MNIIISNSSDVPIYEQVKKAIIEAILKNDLPPSCMLPSIRSLAKDAKISIMTVKKAYDELESAGYIKTIAGKGSFVSPQNKDLLLEEKKKELEEACFQIVDLAKMYQISKNELLDLIKFLYGSEDNE